MGNVSEGHSEDVQGCSGARGSDVGENGFPTKREGGVLRDRSCGDSLGGECGSGKFSD